MKNMVIKVYNLILDEKMDLNITDISVIVGVSAIELKEIKSKINVMIIYVDINDKSNICS